jgi:Protein of unknown function (DUF1367).
LIVKINLIKTISGLTPADPESKKNYDKIKPGALVITETKVVRNPAFLRKWFALLKIGFDNWEPPKISSEYGTPEKNFERFRKDVIILCGYYNTVIRLDSSVRIEPKSVSFANMLEEQFADLYNKTIDLLIKRVYGGGMSPKDLDNIVNQYLDFT